jgi:hypothetical protein
MERLNEGPDDAGAVVGWQQLVEREELHLDLLAIRTVDAGASGGIFGAHPHVLAPSQKNTSPKQ